ncbi:hypothetical protein [Mesorhizobium sp. Cs1299R1N3]|uniref:hypothetical protein n=1 Tax=Mesorhizobium sp. Cs1299R1N3 TaxID=3015173 RepID=UPI00301BD380
MRAAVNSPSCINAEFYARGYAVGLLDGANEDVAGLAEERDIAVINAETERVLRLHAEDLLRAMCAEFRALDLPYGSAAYAAVPPRLRRAA